MVKDIEYNKGYRAGFFSAKRKYKFKWTSVNDKLPPVYYDKNNHMCYMQSKDVFVVLKTRDGKHIHYTKGCLIRNKEGKERWSTDLGSLTDFLTVVAWMPIFKYKEENNHEKI